MWGRELHPDAREGLPAGSAHGRSAPARGRGTKAAWGDYGEETMKAPSEDFWVGLWLGAVGTFVITSLLYIFFDGRQ